MDPTSLDVNNPEVVNQETLDKSNVQKRIDELTAEKHASAKQVEQLTETVALMLRKQTEQAQVVAAPVQEQIPEGLDPAIAQYLKAQINSVKEEATKQSQQLFWQMQHQIDQQSVQAKYSHLPAEVLKDAAQRLTGLKQQYGNAATMDDAVGFAELAWYRKQAQQGRAQQFNGMNQPLSPQGGGLTPPQQSTNLVSPASLPNWDQLDLDTQVKLTDKWVAAGGKLLG